MKDCKKIYFADFLNALLLSDSRGILHMVSERSWNARAYWAQNAAACLVWLTTEFFSVTQRKPTSSHCSSNLGTLSCTQYTCLLSCPGEVNGREELCASRRNSLLFEDEGQVEKEAYEASKEEAQGDEVEIEVKRLCIFQVIYISWLVWKYFNWVFVLKYLLITFAYKKGFAAAI